MSWVMREDESEKVYLYRPSVGLLTIKSSPVGLYSTAGGFPGPYGGLREACTCGGTHTFRPREGIIAEKSPASASPLTQAELRQMRERWSRRAGAGLAP